MKTSLGPVTFLRPGSRARALEQRLQDELTIYVGRRSDSLLPQTRGQRPPLTDRDLERDAELQEVTRAFSHLRSVARRDRRNLYALWSLTTLLVAIVVAHPSWNGGGSVTRTPAAAAARPSPVPNFKVAPIAGTPEASTDRPPSAVIAPPQVLAAASAVRVPLPPALATPAPLVAAAATPAAVRPSAPVGRRLEEAAGPREPAPAAAPSSAPAAEAQRVFSIDGAPLPQVAAATPIVQPPTPAPPAAQRPGSGGDDVVARPVRRAKYGHAGVITLMEKGAVVFDADRRAQRLVPVGGELPDGSILRSVDQKAGRISTDRGEIQFVQ